MKKNLKTWQLLQWINALKYVHCQRRRDVRKKENIHLCECVSAYNFDKCSSSSIAISLFYFHFFFYIFCFFEPQNRFNVITLSRHMIVSLVMCVSILCKCVFYFHQCAISCFTFLSKCGKREPNVRYETYQISIGDGKIWLNWTPYTPGRISRSNMSLSICIIYYLQIHIHFSHHLIESSVRLYIMSEN